MLCSQVGIKSRVVSVVLMVMVTSANGRLMTFSNSLPRITSSGNLSGWNMTGEIVDSHSNIIVQVNGTFFLYGEYHANGHDEGKSSTLPKLSVYTSEDMQTWAFRGLLHNNTAETWGPAAARMNFWCPNAVWDERRQRMVLYFTNQGVRPAQWGVATSQDGIHFDLVSLASKSSQTDTGSVDGNALLIDDDGVGYIAFSTVQKGGSRSGDHMITIDRLEPDLLSSTRQLAAPIFPDPFVEGVLFFKRGGYYYLVYSSCCCCCTAGAGAVVWRSSHVVGPWARQPRDVNCHADAPICAGMVAPQKDRPMGQLVVPAQGFNVARLGRPDDDDLKATYLWMGERWLSGPFAPSPMCTSDCSPATGVCARDPRFRKGHEFTYWAPLEFDDSHAVKIFKAFQSNVTVEVNV